MDAVFDGRVFAVVIVGWVFSLCLHEFSHALVAYHGGDRSVRDKGYLTFNPIRYTDPFMSLVLPLLFLMIGGIGLPGGAVYIDTGRLRSRHWDCAVSLAGPLSNCILLLVLMVPFYLGLVDTRDAGPYWQGYAFLCRLQVMAIIFNLLPVPPLDGFQAIGAYLKPSWRAWCHRQSTIFFLVLLVLLWRVRDVGGAFFNLIDSVCEIVGVPLGLAEMGFWKIRPF